VGKPSVGHRATVADDPDDKWIILMRDSFWIVDILREEHFEERGRCCRFFVAFSIYQISSLLIDFKQNAFGH
jgi:hypothetical protein